MRHKGINYTIPRRSNECQTGPLDKAIYKQRNRVERLIYRLEQRRRIATKCEKHTENYKAMLTIAAIPLVIVCRYALVLLYWRIGRDILSRQQEKGWAGR